MTDLNKRYYPVDIGDFPAILSPLGLALRDRGLALTGEVAPLTRALPLGYTIGRVEPDPRGGVRITELTLEISHDDADTLDASALAEKLSLLFELGEIRDI